MTATIRQDYSCRVGQAHASLRCVSASRFRCWPHGVTIRNAFPRALAHRGLGLLDAPDISMNNPGQAATRSIAFGKQAVTLCLLCRSCHLALFPGVQVRLKAIAYCCDLRAACDFQQLCRRLDLANMNDSRGLGGNGLVILREA